jgi:predicted nucleic acid-binding protein
VALRVTLDSGVVSALATGDRGVLDHLEALRRSDVEAVVPTPVIAESTTGDGPRDAGVNLVVKGCRVEPTTEAIARRAAALRYKARRADATIDALVVATAELVGGGVLLTRDLDDCAKLAEPTKVRVRTP